MKKRKHILFLFLYPLSFFFAFSTSKFMQKNNISKKDRNAKKAESYQSDLIPDWYILDCIRPMVFEGQQLFTAEVYFSEKKPSGGLSKKDQLIYTKTDLDLKSDLFEQKINVTLPKKAMNNGTFYSRVIIYPNDKKNLAIRVWKNYNSKI